MMKSYVVASFGLAVLLCSPAAFADPSDDASGALGCAGLSVVAVPICLGAAASYATAGASEGLVTIVDKGGGALSELTSDVLDDMDESTCCDSTAPRVQVNKKEIPLAVRKDYLELNQKVKTE